MATDVATPVSAGQQKGWCCPGIHNPRCVRGYGGRCGGGTWKGSGMEEMTEEAKKEMAAVLARARDFSDCKRAAQEAVEKVDEARDFACAAMEAADESRRAVERTKAIMADVAADVFEHRRIAGRAMWLDVAVLVAALGMLVMTAYNFFG